MPEQKSLITENVIDMLSDLLGRKIEYCTDEGKWEEDYLSGFDSCSPPSVELYPPYESAWGHWRHIQNDISPFPFPGHDARIKVTNPERLRLLAVEPEEMKRLSGDEL